MNIREITSSEEWDERLKRWRYASALQSWGWGEVKKRTGWQVQRLLIEHEGTPLAQLQILRRSAGPLTLHYVPRGPAFDDWASLEMALGYLKIQLKGAYLKVEPPLALPEAEPPPPLPGASSSETIQPEFSLQVLLDDEAAVLGRMKSKTRYNIRLSARKGVRTRIVRPFDPEANQAFAAFFERFQETNQRAKLRQHDESYYLEVFHRFNARHAQSFISLAEFEGEVLAAGLFIAFKDRIDYLYGGSTRKKKEVMAPYAMHWAAMRWGLAHGFRYYDLWGVPRIPDPSSHAYGIYRFKEGFGGVRVRFPAYDLPLSPLYAPLKRALRWRKDLMNWRARGTRKDVL